MEISLYQLLVVNRFIMILQRIILLLKLLTVTIVLISIDVSMRYFIETHNLMEVRPWTLPFYDGHYFRSLFALTLYVLVFMGWSYLIVTIVFYGFKKKSIR